jgi:hypothetical protein
MARGYAIVDFAKSDFALELICYCGHDCYGLDLLPNIVCPACQRTFEADTRLDFLPEGADPWGMPSQGPGNCFQWKNVMNAHLDCHCDCGHQFAANEAEDGGFLHTVTCPSCRKEHTNPVRLKIREITGPKCRSTADVNSCPYGQVECDIYSGGICLCALPYNA